MNEKEELEFEKIKELQAEMTMGREAAENRKRDLYAISDEFERLLSILANAKPEERCEEARRFAVTITELEKTAAYFKAYIIRAM